MSSVAARYARALHGALESAQELEARLPRLRALALLDEQTAQKLGDSTLALAARDAALTTALGNPAKDSILGRLAVALSSRRRHGFLPAICAQVLEIEEAARGLVRGTIRSRHALSADFVKSLETALSREGRKVSLDSHTDPSILGGFRVEIGSQVVDATANNQLNQARRALMSA